MKGNGRGIVGVRNRIAHGDIFYAFDTRGDITDFACGKRLLRLKPGVERADFRNVELLAPRKCLYSRTLADGTVHNSHKADNAFEIIVITVENKGFERRVVIAFRRRNKGYYLFQNLVDIDSVFGGNSRSVRAVQPDYVFDFFRSLVRVGGGKVDFIDYGYDFEIVIKREIAVGEGLSLDSLRCVDNKYRPLARGERTGNFICEVDVSRGVDKIENIILSVLGFIRHSDGRELYGYAPFSFEVHRVEELIFHISLGNLTGKLHNSVRQRRFAVVYMGYYAKVSDIVLGCYRHLSSSL